MLNFLWLPNQTTTTKTPLKIKYLQLTFSSFTSNIFHSKILPPTEMKLRPAICSLRTYCSISTLSPIYLRLSQSRLSQKAAWIKTIAIATSLGDDVLSMELSFLSLVIPTHRFSSPKLIKQFHPSNNLLIKLVKENSPHHPSGLLFLPMEIPC